jgi:hypothetical protein
MKKKKVKYDAKCIHHIPKVGLLLFYEQDTILKNMVIMFLSSNHYK